MLKKEPNTEVAMVDGNIGELTVSVNDKVVAKKRWFVFLPRPEKVLEAVRQSG